MDMITGTRFGVVIKGDFVVKIFDEMGARAAADGKWYSNSVALEVAQYRPGTTTTKMSPVPVVSPLAKIREMIGEDDAAGNGNRLAGLRVSSRVAMLMCLEDVITFEHFRRATETPDGKYVIIPNIEIDGRLVTVRVYSGSTPEIATTDGDDVVL